MGLQCQNSLNIEYEKHIKTLVKVNFIIALPKNNTVIHTVIYFTAYMIHDPLLQ